jgi:DNA-binding PadR family transcriptional regulator
MRRPTIGTAIQTYLLTHGSGSPYDVYLALRKENPKIHYTSVYYIFEVAKKEGLIDFDRYECLDEQCKRKKIYYRLRKGRENDPCWRRISRASRC